MDFYGLIWLIAFGLMVRYGLPWILAYRRKQRLAASALADIDRMNGRVFEQYLEALFGKLGCQVRRTPYVGDYGADLILQKNGVKTVVQAKRHAHAVGIQAVQEAVAAKSMYGCTEAMVVTSSTYTRAARELAQANHVELWDRTRLSEAILQVRGEAAVIGPASAEQTARCAVCGVPVSEKVQAYCTARPARFQGRVFCYSHQKATARKGA